MLALYARTLLAAVAVAWTATAEPRHELPQATDQESHLATAQAQDLRLVGHLQLAADPSYQSGDRPQVTDLYVAGDYALVGSFGRQLYVVDISDPVHMRRIATVTTDAPPVDVKIRGTRAYVGLQEPDLSAGGLLVLDLTAPAAPTVLAQLPMGANGGVHNLFVEDDRVYVAHSARRAAGRGLTVVNIADPAQPFVTTRWTGAEAGFSNVIHDVFVEDGMAYLCDIVPGEGGLVILDLADPDRPRAVGHIAIPEGVHSAWKVGPYVYCNQEFGGWDQPLYIVDVADPTRPQIVGRFAAQGPPSGRILGPHNPIARDGLLYWAYYDAGVRVFDLKDPLDPREIAYHTAPFAWSAQPHDDGYIYATDSGRGGIMAFRLEGPHALPTEVLDSADPGPGEYDLVQSRPNPFNGATQIGFSLSQEGEVSLVIFNAAGQKVRSLVDSRLAAGGYTVVWDGTDKQGRSLASGVYLYRLLVGGRALQRSLVLLR